MALTDFLATGSIELDLPAESKEAAIAASVRLLGLEPRANATLLRLLARRELLGSTGVGRGIAIPHCRSLVVTRLRMAYARLATPLPWEAIDGLPVRHLFLIVAPPVEVANQYLPTLGALAQFARDAANVQRLERAATAEQVAAVFRGGA
jgi:mannitol/fructose-specific phosphotransferase system IIA component (Ntr-type)